MAGLVPAIHVFPASKAVKNVDARDKRGHDGSPSSRLQWRRIAGIFSVTENDHADVKRLSFEKAIEELESIVKRLEEGKVPLEESVAIYERGEALKRRCEELLRQAEARVEKITLDASGKPKGTEPLDVG
jgi:exodeoxyribonuclease VII small subunit